MRKAKQLEYLISVLPASSSSTTSAVTTEDDEDADLVELEREMQCVNEEYLDALAVAGALPLSYLTFPQSCSFVTSTRPDLTKDYDTELLHDELKISLRTALDARSSAASLRNE